MSENKRIRAVVIGRVQGVGFRYFTQAEASAVGVSGFVRNLPDGSVELEAEGSPDQLDRLIAAVQRGPTLSRVNEVRVSDRPASGGDVDFRITH